MTASNDTDIKSDTAASYDPDNVFAKILRGELPCHKLYEDAATFAMLDIMPRTDGHLLVIPKNPSRNLLDIANEDLNAVMATVQLMARTVMKAFYADGVTIQQFNESAGGQVIFHSHFHVLPRHEGVSLRPHTGEMADQTLLGEQAEKIREVLNA